MVTEVISIERLVAVDTRLFETPGKRWVIVVWSMIWCLSWYRGQIRYQALIATGYGQFSMFIATLLSYRSLCSILELPCLVNNVHKPCESNVAVCSQNDTSEHSGIDQGRYLKRCSQCGHSMSPARYQDNPSEEKEAERRGAPSPMTRV